MKVPESEVRLPAGFEPLESYVMAWALPTEEARYAKRIGSSLSEVRMFYDAIYPRMESVMKYLSAYSAEIASLSTDTRRLYRLALSYFEVSHPIELHWSGTEPADAFPANRIVYHGPSRVEN